MPNFSSGNFKQKNKSFKGGSRCKKLEKKHGITGGSKTIKKDRDMSKNDRKNQKKQIEHQKAKVKDEDINEEIRAS